ncbi:MAG: 3-carboxy-cis,cis-muconate cycloisomerase, partial [Actinomycetota bacterium]|nr:3-carboxy-cis,cis-muconate cycloisomerase [Actinomycetota bacterium]
IMAEAAMIALGRTVGHARAHEVVAAAAGRASAEARDLASVLADDPEVVAHLTADEIGEVLAPSAYVDLAAQSVTAVVSRDRTRNVELA